MAAFPPSTRSNMPIQDPLKVLVVDDHIGVRNGIASLVDAERPRMCTVGAAANVAQALELARQTQPNVVVLDVDLGGEDGLVLIATLHAIAPCQVVVLTSLADPHVAAHAHRLGASACVHKTAPAADLIACILAAQTTAWTSGAITPLNAGSGLSHVVGSIHPQSSGEPADAPWRGGTYSRYQGLPAMPTVDQHTMPKSLE